MVCELLVFLGVGLVLLPLYRIFYAVCVVLGTVRASRGVDFRYPLMLRLLH